MPRASSLLFMLTHWLNRKNASIKRGQRHSAGAKRRESETRLPIPRAQTQNAMDGICGSS